MLFEAPYLHHEELGYRAISAVSEARLIESYELLGQSPDGVGYYQHHRSTRLVAGKLIDHTFYFLVSLSARKHRYAVSPTQLDRPLQISMVNVHRGEEEQGHTIAAFKFFAQRFDLVSNHEQYLGAQCLWRSLARQGDVNIFVFDGQLGDYRRDRNGQICRYSGQHIPADQLWGDQQSFRSTLLVASRSTLPSSRHL